MLSVASIEPAVEIDLDAVVARACRARELFENWNEEGVDRLLHAIATETADAAETLASAAVSETGLGNVRDKTLENRFAGLGLYRTLAGKVAHGTLSSDPERQVTEVASAVGVVFAIVPVTTPPATAIFKVMISLKSRTPSS
jgi:acetaldehyde dehydrogenase/alcohol dehydrogenase